MTEVSELTAEISVDGADAAVRGLKDVDEQVEKLGDQFERSGEKSDRYDQAMRDVSKGALVAGAGLLTMAGGAVLASANFDQALSGVEAVSGATADEMDRLRQAALDAGQATVFSASEAATAEAELAKAGVSTSDILSGALTGSLNLAAAGQLDLTTSATIAGQALNIFNLEGAETSRVADVLAAGANKSAADVLQLGDALAQGGLVAKGANLSLEETVGVLSLFADNALVGSDAGTSLKAMILALQGPSEKSRALMDDLGLSVYDASGEFIGMEGLAGQLQDRLGGLTQQEQDFALAQIFGNDAVRAARALMSEGADGVRDYTDAVNDQGAAQRMASTQLDNLAGDLEQLKGSLETALIETGSKANDTLRGLTQSATGLVNEFAQAPSWLQSTVMGITGVGGTALTAAGGISFLSGKAKEAKASFTAMSSGGQIAMIGLTSVITVGTLALASWAREKEQARQSVMKFTDAIRADSGALGANNRALIENELQNKSVLDDLAKMEGKLSSGRHALDVMTAAVGGNTDAQREFRQALLDSGEVAVDSSNKAGRSIADLEQEYVASGEVVDGYVYKNVELAETFEGLVDAHADAAKAYEASENATRTAADVTRELASAESELRDLVASGAASTVDLAVARSRVATLTAEAARLDDAAAEAAGRSTAAIDTQTGAVEDATEALDDYKDRLDALIDIPMNLEQASLAWTESIWSLTESLTENGATLDAQTEAGVENRKSIMDVVDAAVDHAQAVADQTGNIALANAVLTAHREQLIDTLVQTGLSRQEAEAYADQLGLIPENIRTGVSVVIDAATQRALDQLERLGPQGAVSGNGVTAHGAAPRIDGSAATGAYVPATPGGQLWRVAEAGEGEFIVPESQVAALRGGSGGGVQVVVNLDLRGAVVPDPDVLAPIVREALAVSVRDAGVPAFLSP